MSIISYLWHLSRFNARSIFVHEGVRSLLVASGALVETVNHEMVDVMGVFVVRVLHPNYVPVASRSIQRGMGVGQQVVGRDAQIEVSAATQSGGGEAKPLEEKEKG